MRLDWGNVPTWIGSILTSLSLVLAFSILIRDRKKATKSQIDRIGVWTTHEHETHHWLLHVTNKSELPIHAIQLAWLSPYRKRNYKVIESIAPDDAQVAIKETLSPKGSVLDIGTIRELLPFAGTGRRLTSMTNMTFVIARDNAGRNWKLTDKGWKQISSRQEILIVKRHRESYVKGNRHIDDDDHPVPRLT